MLGIAEKKFVVGRVNEGYHLNPHIDVDSIPPSQRWEEDQQIEALARMVNRLVIRSRKTFCQAELKAFKKYLKGFDLNHQDEFDKILSVEEDDERLKRITDFLFQDRKRELGF